MVGKLPDTMQKQTVLAIDDSLEILTLVKEVLSPHYRLRAVTNGKKALQLINKSQPDIILLDVMMPELDGYEICQVLKKNPKTSDIPVIFLTAKTDHKDEAFGLSLGAVDYIAKPLSPVVLRSRVKTHLSLKNTYDELNDYKNNLEQKVEEEIKKRQEQEKMLIVQSKLAAMGEMIDAVAHQWKQPLNSISINAQMLPFEYDQNKVDKDYLINYVDEFMMQMRYMTTTLDDFRNFFRPDVNRIQLDFRQVLEQVFLLVKDDLKQNNIDCEINIVGYDRVKIRGVETELKNIFINLIANARDAFNEKKIDARKITFRFENKGAECEISVQDNAGGISEAIIHDIFKPNVTTKADGKGTGIGLYMCQQIAMKHHGKLSVKNTRDGACFTLYLPCDECLFE